MGDEEETFRKVFWVCVEFSFNKAFRMPVCLSFCHDLLVCLWKGCFIRARVLENLSNFQKKLSKNPLWIAFRVVQAQQMTYEFQEGNPIILLTSQPGRFLAHCSNDNGKRQPWGIHKTRQIKCSAVWLADCIRWHCACFTGDAFNTLVRICVRSKEWKQANLNNVQLKGWLKGTKGTLWL